ncbi:MAG: cytochrome c3 family protein [Bacillota bacterium]|nr:cytochrome c3 family protein [Bacillota bacterium]
MKKSKRISYSYFYSFLIMILLSASLCTLPVTVAFSAAGDPPGIVITSPTANEIVNTPGILLSGTYMDDNVQQVSDLLFTAYDNGVQISDSDTNAADWTFGSNGTTKIWSLNQTLLEGNHDISVEIKEKYSSPDPLLANASVSFTVAIRPYISVTGILNPNNSERIGEDLTRVPQDALLKVMVVDDNPMTNLVNKIDSLTAPYNPFKVISGSTVINGTANIKETNSQPGKYSYDLTFTPNELFSLNTTYWVYLDKGMKDDSNNPIYSKRFNFTTKSNMDETENPHGHYALNTNMCAGCHSTHVGMNNSLEGGSYQVAFADKLKADPSSNYCMACHDGTTNAPIIDKINNKYHHNNPSDYSSTGVNALSQAESCTSCHNPHLEWSEQNQNLLKDHYIYTHKTEDRNKNGLTSLVVDSLDTSCDSCHDDSSIYNQTAYPGVYEVLAYNKASMAVGTITPKVIDKNPDVVTQTVSDYSLCLRCHNAAKKKSDTSMADIESYYVDPSSAHNFTLPEGKQSHEDGTKLNGPIPCAECHDTHGSDNIKLLRSQLGNAETDDTFTMSGKVWTAAYERQFCSKCHNGLTDIYGKTGKIPDISKSEGHDPSTQKGKQACSTCHSNSYDPQKADSYEKAFLEAAHAPKTGVDRVAP